MRCLLLVGVITFFCVLAITGQAKSQENGSANQRFEDKKINTYLSIAISLISNNEEFIQNLNLSEEMRYKYASDFLEYPAEQGNAIGQYYLGLNYLYGLGRSADPDVGITWLKKAANQNYADAQSQLGTIYFRGEMRPKNLIESEFWHKKAAMNGNQFSMYSLGVFYSSGWAGLTEDFQEANIWLNKAIEVNSDPEITKISKEALDGNLEILEMEKVIKRQEIKVKQAEAQAEIARRNNSALQDIIRLPKNTQQLPPIPRTIRCQHIGNQTTCREF